jgi:transposase InsO family protein
LVRWRLRLEEYDYTISYEKGKTNTNADALSRIELQNNEINPETSYRDNGKPLSMVVNHSDISDSDSDSEYNTPLAILARNTRLPEDSTSDEDDIPLAMLAAQNNNRDPQPYPSQSTVHSEIENPVLEIPITEKQINTLDNQLFLNFVYHSPTKPKVLKIFPNKNRILAQINKNNIQNDIIKLFKDHIKPNIRYGIFTPDEFIPAITSILQNMFKNSAYNLIFCKAHVQDVPDRERQFEIIRHIHDGPTNHRGILETERRIRLQYYWPNIKNSVTKYINNCDICLTNKYERHPNKQTYQIVPLPARPFEVLHVDTFTVNNQKFLTIIDLFSKYAQAYPLQSVTGLSVLNALSIYMSHHGPPLCITADQGTEFKNQLIKELAKLHKIKLHLISVNNPESNGAIERFHSTILEHIRIISSNQSDLTTNELMVYAIIGYNNSIHSATKKKPIEVINGHFNNKDLFDIDVEGVYLQHYINRHKDITKELYANVNRTLLENQERVMANANLNRSDPPLYAEKQAMYVKNPAAVRQKTKPRYLGRRVKKNLDLKVIDDKDISHHKRTLRVPLKQQKPLLQDPPDRSIAGPSSNSDEAG